MTIKEKPGFMIYFNEWYAPMELLDGDAYKELFSDVTNFAKDGEIPQSFSSKTVEVFFKQIHHSILKDDERFRNVCEKRREAGKASVNKRQQVLTNVDQYQSNSNSNSNPNNNTNTIQYKNNTNDNSMLIQRQPQSGCQQMLDKGELPF